MRICTHQRLICGILGAKPRLNITQWRFSHTYNLTQLTLTKDPAAISKAKQLEPLIHDDQNDVLINLFRDTPREKIGVMTLGEALRDYIQPGVALVPHRRFQQPINSTRKPPAYTLKNLDITILESQDMANARKTHRKPTKSSRRFLFGLWSSQNLDHFMRSMNLAWHTLMSGSLVEYQLICKQNQSNQAAFKDMIAKYLHLRPDVILKAMPTKSSIVIQPQTDLKICCWTMGGPLLDHDGNLKDRYDQTYKLDRKRGTLKQDKHEGEVMESRHSLEDNKGIKVGDINDQ